MNYLEKLEYTIILVIESFDFNDTLGNELLKSIHKTIIEFCLLPEDEKELIRNNINAEISDYLMIFSSELAIYGIESNNPDWLNSSIICHSIENFKVDWRENFRVLSILNYAIEELNLDYEIILNEVCKCSSNKANSKLSEFFTRKDSDKSLTVMGLKAKKINNKVIIEQIQSSWMKK